MFMVPASSPVPHASFMGGEGWGWGDYPEVGERLATPPPQHTHTVGTNWEVSDSRVWGSVITGTEVCSDKDCQWEGPGVSQLSGGGSSLRYVCVCVCM